MRKSQVSKVWGHYQEMVDKLAIHIKPRERRTESLYLWGPRNCGKTEQVKRSLNAWAVLFPEEDWYRKSCGQSKWWGNYDNQPICVFDDCDRMKRQDGNSTESDQLKQIMDSTQTDVEVKHGMLKFTSTLIIWCMNTKPETWLYSQFEGDIDSSRYQGASQAHTQKAIIEPLKRRLTESFGCKEIKDRHDGTKIPKLMWKVLCAHFEREIDYDVFKQECMPLPKPRNQCDFELESDSE